MRSVTFLSLYLNHLYVEESHLTLSLRYCYNQEMWLETQNDLAKAQPESFFRIKWPEVLIAPPRFPSAAKYISKHNSSL